jgi:hypothetical protein
MSHKKLAQENITNNQTLKNLKIQKKKKDKKNKCMEKKPHPKMLLIVTK